mmetsp:Transcript_62789/g.182099  ORF Transcript_62789/g.182099 Transcript_62789/m.182099 type:complete len:376 (+) Transcript_62789:104-1231(+)
MSLIDPCSPQEPINTPAVLSHEPWAHPTPSPSDMLKIPQRDPDVDSDDSEDNPKLPALTVDDLWYVCAPFVHQMVQALHQRVVQREQKPPEVDRGRGGGVSRGMGYAGGGYMQTICSAGTSEQSPTCRDDEGAQSKAADMIAEHDEAGMSTSPFQAVLSNPASSCRRPADAQRKGGSDDDERADVNLSGVARQGLQQRRKVSFPSGMGGTPPPTPPIGPQAFASLQPMHEVVLSTTPPAATVQPTPPEQVCEAADAADAGAADSAEKSSMVCRHWKSKGFCKMEDKCKFLHPEHKRGTGVAPVKHKGGGPSSAAAGSDAATPISAAGTDEGAVGGAKGARRAGRNRRGGGSGGSATAVMAPGLVPASSHGSGGQS